MQTQTDPQETWPPHYDTSSQDLYALFIQRYGLDIWECHVEMECIQYLWRCRQKGTYEEDIRKVRVICDRILKETETARHGL